MYQILTKVKRCFSCKTKIGNRCNLVVSGGYWQLICPQCAWNFNVPWGEHNQPYEREFSRHPVTFNERLVSFEWQIKERLKKEERMPPPIDRFIPMMQVGNHTYEGILDVKKLGKQFGIK